MPKVECFSKQAINVIRYVMLEMVDEKSCRILLHDSKHYLRDKGHPESQGEFRIIENGGKMRLADKVEIKRASHTGFEAPVVLTVNNSRNIFDYPRFDDPLVNDETVKELAALPSPPRITRANVDELIDSHRIEVKMASGAWWAIRRNGKTQTWKSQPGRIRIPYKYGFMGYGAITTWDFRDRIGAPLLEGTRDYCDLTQGSLDIAEYRVKPPVV